MRKREVTIPLALWICAAICAHFLFGSGGLVVAKVHEDRAELWKLSREASSLAKLGDQTFEVAINEPSTEPSADVILPPPPKPQAAPAPPPPKTPPVKPVEKPKPQEKRVVVLEKKKDEEKKPLVPPEPLMDRRIAVRQHAAPDQEDNPTAKFIADQANHVKEETRATQTSHDRDDEKPEPGATHRSSDTAPGDNDQTRIADSDEHKGEKNRAPGERGNVVDVQSEPKLPKAEPQPTATAATGPAAPAGARADSTPARPASVQPQDSPPQPAPGGATPPSPEVESAADGTWTFNPARQGGATGTTREATAGSDTPTLPGGKMWTLPGLGQPGAPGSLNVNLNQGEIASIVGSDNLRKLREADGERRRSQHRGSWVASNFDRWRSAIENYVSSVKEGNQTSLNTAQVPFATYLNGMHERIHPIFAESFLGSLDRLPPTHPLNDQELVTRLEIVLTRDGHLKRMGVVRLSGVTAFDIAALDAVDRAQPFGPAPSAIVSPDGNVYLHWEFHRNEIFACSTMGARPFILNAPAPGHEPPALPPAPGPGPSNERGAPATSPNDSREGVAPRPRRKDVAQSAT
jgi:TonB family protein